MTANQRRPGFRLPWSTEDEGSSTDGESAAPEQDATPAEEVVVASVPEVVTAAKGDAAAVQPDAKSEAASEPQAGAKAESTASAEPAAKAEPTATAEPARSQAAAESAPSTAPAETTPAPAADSGDEFMRDLVAAMRAVAEEARLAGVTELKAKADVQVKTLEGDAARRREELHKAADADVAGIGEWASAEAERIKKEAEQKVVARKARLDQELAADASRTEAEAQAVRDRVAAYETELEAYHAQLSQINDPAAFAAAAKRLPKPPALGGSAAAVVPGSTEPAQSDSATNGVAAEADATDAEVLASRLAELDATLPGSEQAPAPSPTEAESAADEGAEAPAATVDTPADTAAASEVAAQPAPEPEAAEPKAPAAAAGEPAVTEVVVKGLGSFGAITGFRQSLSGVDGIDSVALSLGQTGEFVFRATHAPGFDVRAAIAALEGDGAKIEARPEGGLRVTLERAR